MGRENAELIGSIYSNFNDGNLDGILSILSSDMELVDYGINVTYRGADGFLEWLKPWEEAAPDGKADLRTLIADGALVCTEHTHSGTHTGPFTIPQGVYPATGRPMEVQFCEVFEVREGKIVKWRNYWDVGTLLDQIRTQPATTG
jgi:steroid delta-isomerase-like uncharacterized protein